MEFFPAEHLIVDKSYDSDEIVRKAQVQNLQVQIPPRKNRKHQLTCDNPCIVSVIGWKCFCSHQAVAWHCGAFAKEITIGCALYRLA